jgi:hypothetical protein
MAPNTLLRLPGMQPDLPSPDNERLPQNLPQLSLIKQIQHSRPDTIKMNILVA